jgi:hypothetical protein
VWEHRKQERFDQMNEQPEQAQQQPASFLSSLEAMLALRDRIEEESPSLKVLDVCAHPCSPFLIVKDTVHGIVVGFSSEADYTIYVGMVSRSGGNSHA